VDAFAKGVAALLLCVAVIFALCGIVNDSTPQATHAVQTSTVENTKMLTLDTSNNALMHRYGLPTKADAMQWHVHGQWGFWDNGRLIAFDELPGDSRAWDSLYGIDSDNPAFDK